jgi:hypothetical protein
MSAKSFHNTGRILPAGSRRHGDRRFRKVQHFGSKLVMVEVVVPTKITPRVVREAIEFNASHRARAVVSSQTCHLVPVLILRMTTDANFCPKPKRTFAHVQAIAPRNARHCATIKKSKNSKTCLVRGLLGMNWCKQDLTLEGREISEGLIVHYPRVCSTQDKTTLMLYMFFYFCFACLLRTR